MAGSAASVPREPSFLVSAGVSEQLGAGGRGMLQPQVWWPQGFAEKEPPTPPPRQEEAIC